MNEINRVVSAISAVHSVQSSNEWEPRSSGGRWPSRVSPVNGSLQDLTHLKDVLLHCPELHCLVKFIWNNGDLELLPHICVTATEGTIGFYMEHWFIPQLLSRTCEVTEQGISSSGKLLQFECHNSKRWTETVQLSTFIIHSCHCSCHIREKEERLSLGTLTFIIRVSTRNY